jgi:MobA-like NTP transferase domain
MGREARAGAGDGRVLKCGCDLPPRKSSAECRRKTRKAPESGFCFGCNLQKRGNSDGGFHRQVRGSYPSIAKLRLFVLTVVLSDRNHLTRFGRNPGGWNFNADGNGKATAAADDRPLLQHVLDNVRASGVKEIVLVLGFAVEDIRREINLQNVRVVLNESYRQGMGTSLKAGLSAVHSQSAGALIVLADQPFVWPATLDLLMAVRNLPCRPVSGR